MKRKWIGFAALMIMLLAVTVWADNGPGGVYQPCTFGEEKASETEILTVINKWPRELNRGQLQLSGPVYLAGLLDTAPYEIVKGLNLEGLTPVQKVTALAEWIGANMVHTQSLAQLIDWA